MDHRGPEFAQLGKKVLTGMREIFNCSGPVVIYPSSGTGAWEAALVNTLSPGDKIAIVETGQFASLWAALARRLNLEPIIIESDWRRGAEPDRVESFLRSDANREIKAICVVHNETSTGAMTRLDEIREVIDASDHPALFMVDTISGLGCTEFKFDDWKIDVAISGSQKGLMLPPGLSFNAISEKAMEKAKSATMAKSYWDWEPMFAANDNGYFPYTPATNLLYGLAESIDMLHQEGLENVFVRHQRHAQATRAAIQSWELELQCLEPKDYSPVLTAVRLPDGFDADKFRATVLDKFDMSLGNGLGQMAGKVFRIGHLGDFNDLMLMATLCGIEMGLGISKIPHSSGGMTSAMEFLQDNA